MESKKGIFFAGLGRCVPFYKTNVERGYRFGVGTLTGIITGKKQKAESDHDCPAIQEVPVSVQACFDWGW